MSRSRHLSGRRIFPQPLTGGESVESLITDTFTAYNAGRLREAARLYAEKMLQEDVTVGLALSGALTPAGFGRSCLVPLVEAGLVDWIVTTGANLYHDTHHAIGLKLHAGDPRADDVALREAGVVRIYDIVFDYEVLLETDLFYRRLLRLPEFDRPMSTPELHYRIGRWVDEVERKLDLAGSSLLAAAYRQAVPVFTSSPGDSSIGMNVARLQLEGSALAFAVNDDVNLSAAVVWNAKESGGKSACFILGGGSPKNFMLQTEPQIQEVLGIDERGHDYFLQMTDARPDTGGLSGATPAEAVSWGKIDPDQLPGTVVVYGDNSIALPVLTAYAKARHADRPLKRLYGRREAMMGRLLEEYRSALEFRDRRAEESLAHLHPGAGGAETVARR
jgi:deoxyhypusine synthase